MEDRIRAQAVDVLFQQSRHNTLCNALFSPCANDPQLNEEMRRLYFNAIVNDVAQHSGVWYVKDKIEDRVIAICLVSMEGGMDVERARAPEPNWKPFAYKCGDGNAKLLQGLMEDVQNIDSWVQQQFQDICKEHELSQAVYVEYLAVDKRKEGMGIGSALLKTVMYKYADQASAIVLGTSNNNLNHAFFETKCGMDNLSKNGGQQIEIGGRLVDNFWLIKRPSQVNMAAPNPAYRYLITKKNDTLSDKICQGVLSGSLHTNK